MIERHLNSIATIIGARDVNNLQVEEKDNIFNLLVASFSDNRDFHGKIWSNPDLVSCVIAKIGDKIIGFAGITRCAITHDDQAYTIGGFGDLVIDPEYRHLGLATEITNTINGILKVEKYDIGMGFCHPDLVKLYEKGGWIKKPKGRVFVTKDGIHTDKGVTVLYLSNSLFSMNYFWFQDDIYIGPSAW